MGGSQTKEEVIVPQVGVAGTVSNAGIGGGAAASGEASAQYRLLMVLSTISLLLNLVTLFYIAWRTYERGLKKRLLRKLEMKVPRGET